MTPKELRTRAVIAGRLAAHESMDSEENLNTIASRVVDAAEPFIRELVVEQVVEWARNEAHSYYRLDADVAGDNWMDVADRLLRQFGGSR